MKINPKTLSWQAPTTNTDGTPIQYALEYELGVETNGAFVPQLTVPAQLNSDGRYEAAIEGMAFEYGQHTVAMRTFAKDEPARKSVWSASVNFTLSRQIPNPPMDLALS